MKTLMENINFFLSGGSNNNNPNASLGGAVSGFPIIGSLNNLFKNITTEEASAGKTDFRCFYIRNSNTTESLFNSKIFIYSQNTSGSSIKIGISKATDSQEVRINGSVISGNVKFRYAQQELTVPWGGSAAAFSSNLVSSLNSIGVSGVQSSFLTLSLTNTFTLLFKGASDQRNHQVLEVFSNSLIGASKPIVTTRKITEGRPINSIAPTLATETVPPSGVEFFDSSSDQKIELGTLKPGDFVPIWIQRTTSPNTDFEEKDYFIFKIQGEPFLSAGGV